MKVVPAPSVLSAVMAAAVQPDEFLDQRQADSAALGGAGLGGLDPVEPLEEPGHLGGRDADAGVGDAEDRVAAVAATRTVIDPSKVNFSALDSRLRTTFSHMSRST